MGLDILAVTFRDAKGGEEEIKSLDSMDDKEKLKRKVERKLKLEAFETQEVRNDRTCGR